MVFACLVIRVSRFAFPPYSGGMVGLLLDICYAVGLLFALPILFIKSRRTGKYRTDWGMRFGRYPANSEFRIQSSEFKRLAIHCVSVGELLSVRQLVAKLLAADPRVQVTITTTTDTGTTRARELYPPAGEPNHNPRVMTLRYPLDFSFAVESFYDHVKPDAVALVELETWPNFIRIAAQRRIPVVIVNGRLTQRSLQRYRLIRPVVAMMMRQLTWLGIQTETIAGRFRQLGASTDRIEVIPTLKYDVADLSDRLAGMEALAAACGIAAEHRLFVGGSTGPGEEDALLSTYQKLQPLFPALRLAIAPRKPETVPQVLQAIRRAGLTAVQRTTRPDNISPPSPPLSPQEILVLDTLGELKKLYALGFGAFVGRSLVPLGGSDMIEVAAMGRPCCFGPHTHNFAEAVELLVGSGAAVEIHGAQDLARLVERWLAQPAEASTMGSKARQVIAAQRGSTDRYVKKLLEILATRPI